MPRASIETPPPLPPGLLADLASHHKITLFLDYDGTLSEITPDVAGAQPVAGATDVIQRLSARPDRFRVILISGRQTDKLVRLINVSGGVTLVGNHGLEIIEPGRSSRMAVAAEVFGPALDAVRRWMADQVEPGAGFLIEDKRFSVALHYRLADPEAAMKTRRKLAEFVGAHNAVLELREGKMVVEAVPRQANKGAAVRQLMQEGGDGRLPIYFGDDITDEDAFYELRDGGVTVKVCAEPCPSWARYRLSSPAEVVAALAQMAATGAVAIPAC